MGFKAKKNLYKLKFADEDMAGFEVMMTSVSMGKLLEIQELSSAGEGSSQDPASFRRLINFLVDAMLSWNLEDDDGHPVPATVEAVLDQDPAFIIQIIGAWTQAISGVEAPLESGSSSGEKYREASLPMEPLSPSLVS